MSKGIEVLFLSMSDVLSVGLSFEEAVSVVGASLREHGAKRVENPPKQPIHPLPDAFINAMPGFLSEKQVCGVKWVAGFPSNTAKSLPTITGVLVLNDPETGFPLAFMDATYITALRTVAVSVVSAEYLCNRDASVMALIGCGVQGRYHAVAMKSILPQISAIKIHDPWEPAVTSFLQDIGPRLPGVRLEEMETPETAIRDADLVITATGRLLQPIFKCEWVKEGALLLPVHTMGWDSATASSMDKLFTDDWQQFLTVGKTAYQPLPDRPHAEIGEVVAGIKPGRESASERIVCFNKGLAIHDVLMGNTIYQKALTQGIGQRLEIQKTDQQLPMLEIE